MRLFARYFLKSSLSFKIRLVESDMKNLLQERGIDINGIWSFGSYEIDPKYLSFWVQVGSDMIKEKVSSDHQLMNELRNLLTKHEYPAKSVNEVFIGVESQETVDRVSNGSWFIHLR